MIEWLEITVDYHQLTDPVCNAVIAYASYEKVQVFSRVERL